LYVSVLYAAGDTSQKEGLEMRDQEGGKVGRTSGEGKVGFISQKSLFLQAR